MRARLRGFEVMSRGLELMQDVVSRYRLAGFDEYETRRPSSDDDAQR